jgi:transposase InsO family protein
MVKYLCSIAGVSRSGYYNYLNSEKFRSKRKMDDLKSKRLILKAFNRKGFKKGARSIKMILENDFNIVFNLKKIRRIMKKYGIVCPHRKSKRNYNIQRISKENSIVPNKLNRNFKQNKPFKVLLTDITYLKYGNGKRAYLSAIKDGTTNEILAHKVSNSLDINFVLATIKCLTRKNSKLPEGCLIHSDQGSHYTSLEFQKLLKEKKIEQSMSRRGNCWDNAPIESFFGHMKDDIELKSKKNLYEVKAEIDRYMIYYNNFRYQWNLKKMTPVQYRNHLLLR